MDLRAFLVDAGVHPLEVSHAEADGEGALIALAFEHLLLPGDRRTPLEVFAETGVDPDFGRAIWRSMGFASVPDDIAAFAPADSDALRSVQDLFDSGLADEETVLRMTRLIAQAMARISDALVSQLRQRIDEGGDEGDVDDVILAGNVAVLPTLETQLVYLLRRHLVDAARRQIRTAEDGASMRTLTVGFADLVRFTEVSQRLEEGELERLIDGFESTASAIITGGDGQVVKLIGDEVLFSAESAAAAVDIGLALVEAFSADDVPDVRVGVAHGSVLVHQGDLFGPVVNLASRAVGVATPGSVLVDDAVADLLDPEDDELRVTAIRTRNLKGIGRTRLYLVRDAKQSVEVETPLAHMMKHGRARRAALADLWRIE